MSWTTEGFYKQPVSNFCQQATKPINKSPRKTVVYVLKGKKPQETALLKQAKYTTSSKERGT